MSAMGPRPHDEDWELAPENAHPRARELPDPEEVRRLVEEAPRSVVIADEAAIALAFAIFILEGAVPRAVQNLALAAAAREELEFVIGVSWEGPAAKHRAQRVKRDRAKLTEMPLV